MITVAQAIVLAVIQGLTEFFPVSSTAHLTLVPWLFHWPDPGLTFDVALHAGTLLAVVAFFFVTWVRIVRVAFGARLDVHGGGPLTDAALAAQRKLLWLLVAATVPGAIVGKLFEKQIESAWRNPLIVAAGLIVVAVAMGWADRQADAPPRKDYDRVTLGDALAVGCAQALAVVPGVSRSGSTITAGLFCGLTREAAARFSFLLATPIIAGACLEKGLEVRRTGIPAAMHAPFAVGIAVSALVGLAAIALFIRFLQARTLRLFVIYRLVLGAVVIALYAAGFRRF